MHEWRIRKRTDNKIYSLNTYEAIGAIVFLANLTDIMITWKPPYHKVDADSRLNICFTIFVPIDTIIFGMEEIRFSFDSFNLVLFLLLLFNNDAELLCLVHRFTGIIIGLYNTVVFQSAMMLFVPTCQLINVTRHVSLYKPSADEIHKKTASLLSVNLDH